MFRRRHGIREVSGSEPSVSLRRTDTPGGLRSRSGTATSGPRGHARTGCGTANSGRSRAPVSAARAVATGPVRVPTGTRRARCAAASKDQLELRCRCETTPASTAERLQEVPATDSPRGRLKHRLHHPARVRCMLGPPLAWGRYTPAPAASTARRSGWLSTTWPRRSSRLGWRSGR